MHEQHDTIARDIERLANEWMTAVAEPDESTLERILSDEFRLASGMGMVADRST